MPHQLLDRPNPPPLPSHLPDSLLGLAAKPGPKHLPPADVESLRDFYSAACYIAAASIFLRQNVLLDRPLDHDDIKPRLLGHWGTCPGLILIWAHLNLLIRDNDLEMIQVIGPGHGAPAALAALWLEGSLERFYPDEYARDAKGLASLVTRFSVPGGFPSHINAETPGSIHEGGELGYALAVSFGAVMDSPDLIVACVVGDGEAETGPTAAAWHSAKFIDPKESGAVIPILHLNGFKISERTIFGCMDDKELVALFSGYGYQVCIVDGLQEEAEAGVAEVHADLASALQWAVDQIRAIQSAARADRPIVKPRWPMIILKTAKGWGAPAEIHGKLLEGSFSSHQVPLPKAKSDADELSKLGQWLETYRISDLLSHPDGAPKQSILNLLPPDHLKLGQYKPSYAPQTGLDLPDWARFAVAPERDGTEASCMQVAGAFLSAVIEHNPTRFRIFSPDELESNKLDAVLSVTGRNMQWDQRSRAQGGRVVELLSEHCCQGFMQGYTLTGRTALFPSYESFLGIVHTMMVQYSKFTKIAAEVRWRTRLGSINYVESSTWARQEHNGFSHQNPSFIGAVLSIKADAARVYLPPDANCLLSTVHHCLGSRGYVNLVIGSKQPTAVYLGPAEAREHCRVGAGVFPFFSTDRGRDPDVVLVGIGVETTLEVVQASALLAEIAGAGAGIRVRVVNVTDLMILADETRHPHSLSESAFEDLFTLDRPVIFNYHGYATELQGLLFGRQRRQGATAGGGQVMMSVEGYREEGSTTTPFDMMLVNHVSRFHVARRAVSAVAAATLDDVTKKGMIDEITRRETEVKRFIREHGKDPDDIYSMPARMEGGE